MDPFRFIQVYIVQFGVGIAYLVVGLLVLKRDRKRLNLLVAIFYFQTFLGFLLNIIYAPLNSNPIVTYLHLGTIYLLFSASVYLVLFSMVLWKSLKVFNTMWQIIYWLFFMGIYLRIFFNFEGLIIDATTSWKPVWNLDFTLRIAIFPLLFGGGLADILSIIIYTRFSDPILKKKWKFYLIANLAYTFLWAGTVTSNTINHPLFRSIWSLISLVLLVIICFGIYIGLGKQLSNQERIVKDDAIYTTLKKEEIDIG